MGDLGQNGTNQDFSESLITHDTSSGSRIELTISAPIVDDFLFHKQCNEYWPSPGEAKDCTDCQCGLKFDDHSEEVKIRKLETKIPKTNKEKWNSITSTIKTEWKCFGNILFENQETVNAYSPYIRVNDDVDASQLVEYLLKKWQLPTPSLIVSVTGGASDFAMDKEDHEKLRLGLQKIAATEGAWLITGGTNAGIMKICGEAARDSQFSSVSARNDSSSRDRHQVVAIGIATWGSIKGRQALIPPEDHNPNSSSIFEAQYQKPFIGTGLDPNHTHFIFADDGSNNQFGKERELRGRFEKVVCERGVAKKGTPVPIVCVMVEGGPGTIDTVRHALLNGTPCVIIDGSGRAADVLAYATKLFNKLKQGDKLIGELNDKLRTLIIAKVEKTLELKEEKLTSTVDCIDECLKNSRGIQIFSLNKHAGESTTSLDKAILQALLDMGSSTLTPPLQLRLCFLWDREDIAENIINKAIKIENESNQQVLSKGKEEDRYVNWLTTELLADLSMHAIEHNKVAFFKLLLEFVPLVQLLTEDKLIDLYKSSSKHQNTVLQNFLDGFERKFLKISRSCGRSVGKALFVQSVLFVRLEMSVYLWEQLPGKTSAALFATLLTKRMLTDRQLKIDINLQKSVEDIQNEFETRANGIINACYANSVRDCHNLLEAKHESWKGKSCLDLADEANAKSFIAQSASQSLIRKSWFGKISDETPKWKIILATVCPIIVKFDEEEPHKNESAQQKSNADERGTLSLFDRYQFFYQAPIASFILKVMSDVLLLVLFSFVVMTGLTELPSTAEWLLIGWLITFSLEEVRQLAMSGGKTLHKKVKKYFADRWNFCDVTSIVLIMIAILLRFLLRSDLLNVAHGFYVMSLIVFFIRFTSVFSVSNNLGPKIVMIAKMMNDLGFFMFIALVYILAYGIAVQALIYPGVKDPPFSVPWGIFFRPYFEMLGDPNFEEVGATHFDNCTNGSEALWPNESCPEQGIILVIFVVFLKALYMLFTNVLLLNLLIAMFNNRYAAVNEQANEYWKFQRFKFLRECQDRPCLPPPLIVISHIYFLGKFLVQCLPLQPKPSTTNTSDENRKQLEKWEDIRAKEYLRRNINRLHESVEERLRKIDGKSVQINQTASENQIHLEALEDRIEKMEQTLLKSITQKHSCEVRSSEN